MTQTLEEVGQGIVQLISDNEVSEKQRKWQLAGLLAEGRAFHSSNKAFSEWLDSLFSDGSAPSPRPPKPTVTKLLKIRDKFTEEQFMQLGYAKCAELISAWLWKSEFDEQRNALIIQAQELSQRELRLAVAILKAGGVAPQTAPKQAAASLDTNAQVEALMARLDELERENAALREAVAVTDGIRRGDYFYSEDEPLHPDNDIAIRQLSSYIVKSFENELHRPLRKVLSLPEDEVVGKSGIRKVFRRLAHRFHPDHGGSVKHMDTLTRMFRDNDLLVESGF